MDEKEKTVILARLAVYEYLLASLFANEFAKIDLPLREWEQYSKYTAEKISVAKFSEEEEIDQSETTEFRRQLDQTSKELFDRVEELLIGMVPQNG